MKKTLIIPFIMIAMMTTSCMSTLSTVKINKVEIGMTKADISKLLGTPMFKNGDTLGEQWGYQKMVGEVAGPEPVIFLVTFDADGKVISYETLKDRTHYHH
ncbi:MAG: outer membrane protein assembly factor BamE [Bacteroidaceae bacterium]|nr:outer membrane protein assembly factor BamE [Bacteroidaceae bacterium]